jgi:hypothetical protein
MEIHKKAKNKFVSINESGHIVEATINHVLLKAALKHGREQCAVDISSAHTPVMPFIAYLALVIILWADHT